MSDSSFWRDLAIQFRELPRKVGVVFGDRYIVVGAGPIGTWHIRCDSQAARVEFETLARRGATRISNRVCSDLLTAWLEALALYKDRESVTETPGDHAEGGVRQKTMTSSYDLILRSANYCKVLESEAIQAEFEEAKKPPPPISAEYIDDLFSGEPALSRQPLGDANTEPKALRDRYFANFPEERIKIRDVCWAVQQHYREWKRWLGGELKSGSTADLAFRRILNSGKRPLEFNKRPRPKDWE